MQWTEERVVYAPPATSSQKAAFALGVGIGAILGATCTMAGIAFAFFTSGAR